MSESQPVNVIAARDLELLKPGITIVEARRKPRRDCYVRVLQGEQFQISGESLNVLMAEGMVRPADAAAIAVADPATLAGIETAIDSKTRIIAAVATGLPEHDNESPDIATDAHAARLALLSPAEPSGQ